MKEVKKINGEVVFQYDDEKDLIDKFNFYFEKNKGKNFRYMILENINLSGLNLFMADFSHAILINVVFSKAVLYNCSFENTVMINVNMEDTNIYHCSFDHSSLSSLDFSKSNIRKSSFYKCKFIYLNFNASAIRCTSFDSSVFYESIIYNSEIIESSIIYAKLYNSNLQNCKFSETNLRGLSVMDSILTTNSFKKCIYGKIVLFNNDVFFEDMFPRDGMRDLLFRIKLIKSFIGHILRVNRR